MEQNTDKGTDSADFAVAEKKGKDIQELGATTNWAQGVFDKIEANIEE